MFGKTKLPTRSEFLESLEDSFKLLDDLPDDRRDCHICLEPLKEHKLAPEEDEHATTPSEETDTPDHHGPLQLPCGHLYGESCIMRWLHCEDTRPECRRILFTNLKWAGHRGIDICLTDDLMNLRALENTVNQILNALEDPDDLEYCEQLEQHLRRTLNARAHLYLERRLQPDIEKYEAYVHCSQTTIRDEPLGARFRLFADELAKSVQESQESFLLQDFFVGRATIASHPFATMILQSILEIVVQHDEQEMHAMALGARLMLAIHEHCAGWIRDQQAQPETALPPNWGGYVNDMVEATMMAFMRLGQRQHKG